MSNITEWIKYELYPSLFEIIDQVFPEHDFKRYNKGWRSKTYLDGSAHKVRADKTIINKEAPGLILEQGGEVLSLIDYVIRRDNIEFAKAIQVLAAAAGVSLPQAPDFNQELYKRYKDQITLLEDCNSYFIYCLETSPAAGQIRAYLTNRGYNPEDVKSMELGFIPAQDKVTAYLIGKGYNEALIKEVVTFKPDSRIGASHQLTIPYRSGGQIKGFKFRTINGEVPKYINSSGLDRISGFFNLPGIKGNKDVIIVEGELDSLSATIKGVDNVVATGGSGISPEQVRDAKRRGAKSFSICFDSEPGKEDQTIKAVNAAIDIILAEEVNRIYIVTLPVLNNTKTDPDRLIKERGIEALKSAIATALPYYEYRLQLLITKYGNIQEQRGLQPRDIDNLLEEVVETASKIPDVTDKDRFKKLFTSLDAIQHLGITEESLTITVDKLTSTREKQAQAKELKKLIADAAAFQEKGEIEGALDLLTNKIKDVKLKDRATEFSSLLLPIRESELKERQANKPDSLNSGFSIGGEDLLLPAGALSVLAAPTSHGKTTMLINMALNVANAYPDKETYIFSYEEDGDSILMNALNTHLDTDISHNNRRTIKSYFTTGSTEFIKADARGYFTQGKDQFFKEFIETRRLNIHYANYNSDSLIEAIRYLYKHTNIGAVFIDYIQLLNLPEGKYKTYSRQEEIKEICIALKDLAVETGLPIILGAQFNREVVNLLKIHSTKIGEAGDIERIANLILGFWNNNFKPLNVSDAEQKEIDEKGAIPNTIYATILKQRGGKVGQEEILNFQGNTGKISNNERSGGFF